MTSCRRLLAILALIVSLWSGLAQAAIVNLCGFEIGAPAGATDIEWSNSSGTFSVQSTTKRTGTYALRSNPTGSNLGWVAFNQFSTSGVATGLNAATVCTRMYVNPVTVNGEPFFSARTNSVLKFEARFDSGRHILVYDNTGTNLLATGTTALDGTLGVFTRVEISVGTGASGAWSVTINGAAEISGTGDLTATNTDHIRIGKSTNRATQNTDVYFDDVAVDTAACPGAGAVKIMRPNENGNAMTWTVGAGCSNPNEWDCVDEVPHDSTTSYLLSTLVDEDAAMVGLESAATAGITGTINAVKAVILAKRDSTGNGTIAGRLRSNTTDNTWGNQSVGSTVESFQKVYVSDPATAAAWASASALDSVAVGITQQETTDRTDWMAGYAMVDFVAAGGAPVMGSNILMNGCCGGSRRQQ